MGALYQFRTEDLLALERILDAADGVLDLALHLIGLAFAFRLLVAGHLPNDFFHFAFPLFQGTFHAVSVDHKVTPQCGCLRENALSCQSVPSAIKGMHGESSEAGAPS